MARRRIAVICLLSLAACRVAPPPPPDPGALVALRVRVVPGEVAVRSAAVTPDGTAAIPLRPAADAGTFDGAVPLTPGAHLLLVAVAGPGGAWMARASVPVVVPRGAAGQVEVALGPEGSAPPLLAAVSVARSSVVAGDPVALEARLGAPGGAGASLAWSAEPAGCGRFASGSAAVTSFVPAAAGACTLTVTATADGRSDRRSITLAVRSAGRSFAFPLRPAVGGRHLEDQRGVPFLIKGESAWLALVNLTEAEQEAYLADRAARGFNLVEVMLTNHDYTASPNPLPPANRRGEQPFLRPGDFSTPNDAYFDGARAFVVRAAAHGMVVLLAPNYLGYDGDHEGWWKELVSGVNTREVCSSFGRYLGMRFLDLPNVLWLAGGDFAPPPGSEGEARHWEILAGIRAAGATQPWTGHWNLDHRGGISTDEKRFAAAMELEGVYQYADVWKYTARAFDVQPPRPVFLLESTYEHEHPTSNTQPPRKAWWWSMLSGGSGVIWGNLFLWMSESSRGTYRASYGDTDHALSSWAAELDSPGTREMVHLHAFFEALPWERLVPAGSASGRPELVTAGQRPAGGHIAAAATEQGDLVVAYLPPTRSTPRRFALDLSRLPGPATARWYDPVAGVFTHTVAVPTHGPRVEFETPGTNVSGYDDWALVIQTSPQR